MDPAGEKKISRSKWDFKIWSSSRIAFCRWEMTHPPGPEIEGKGKQFSVKPGTNRLMVVVVFCQPLSQDGGVAAT